MGRMVKQWAGWAEARQVRDSLVVHSTAEEVAKELKITRGRVNQIELAALIKIIKRMRLYANVPPVSVMR